MILGYLAFCFFSRLPITITKWLVWFSFFSFSFFCFCFALFLFCCCCCCCCWFLFLFLIFDFVFKFFVCLFVCLIFLWSISTLLITWRAWNVFEGEKSWRTTGVIYYTQTLQMWSIICSQACKSCKVKIEINYLIKCSSIKQPD